MASNKGFESTRNQSVGTENKISKVWGADSFKQENGWNGNNTEVRNGGGWSNNNGGQSVFSQSTSRQIEKTWGNGMVEELNKGWGGKS